MAVSAAKRNAISALFKNGKFDLTLKSKKPSWYMEFQHETNTVFKAHPLPFLVLKDFLRHYKIASLRHRNVQGSFARWNAETSYPRLKTHKSFCKLSFFYKGHITGSS